jgi:hypothetical protein
MVSLAMAPYRCSPCGSLRSFAAITQGGLAARSSDLCHGAERIKVRSCILTLDLLATTQG